MTPPDTLPVRADAPDAPAYRAAPGAAAPGRAPNGAPGGAAGDTPHAPAPGGPAPAAPGLRRAPEPLPPFLAAFLARRAVIARGRLLPSAGPPRGAAAAPPAALDLLLAVREPWPVPVSVQLLGFVAALLDEAAADGVAAAAFTPQCVLVEDGRLALAPGEHPADADPAYVAPEQRAPAVAGAGAEPGALGAVDDARAAQYGLAMLAVVLLDAAPPAAADFGPAVERVLRAASNPDPARRFPSAGLFVAALRVACEESEAAAREAAAREAARAAAAPAAAPAPAQPPAPAAAGGSRWALVAALLAGIAAFGGAGAGSYLAGWASGAVAVNAASAGGEVGPELLPNVVVRAGRAAAAARRRARGAGQRGARDADAGALAAAGGAAGGGAAAPPADDATASTTLRRLAALAASVVVPSVDVVHDARSAGPVPRSEFAASALGRAALDAAPPAAPAREPAAWVAGAPPRYPDELLAQQVGGEVVARFTIDTAGRVAPGSVTVVRSSHPALAVAVRRSLRRARFALGAAGARTGPRTVEQTFQFEPRG
jgi:TonB family protein